MIYEGLRKVREEWGEGRVKTDPWLKVEVDFEGCKGIH